MILVYSRQRHGGPVLNGYRIPGWLDPLPPTRIPYKLYRRNKAVLKIAPYTKGLLEEMFRKEFPNLTFTPKQIKLLTHSQLVVLCQAFEITSPKIQSTEDRRVAVYGFLKENG